MTQQIQEQEQQYYTTTQEEELDYEEQLKKRRIKFLYKVNLHPYILMIGTKNLSCFGTLIKKEHNFWKNPARRRRRKSKHFSDVA